MSPERTAAHAARDLALLVLVLLRGGRLVSVTVRGASMLPVYQDGDRVLVRRGPTPRRGTVVVAERPDPDGRWSLPALTGPAHAQALAGREWVIKRVAALPGDSLPLGEVPALAAPEAAGTPASAREGASERVPPGKLVLLGDNRDASLDSRHIGCFPLPRILGTVLRALPPAP
ncbi:signal peptidase I [Streptomyces smyrnaeus]|uniref:signal peptidase I n=1 Tax=Streptomyces smyrnaeus TaxID=1387713 RepID=UPI0033F0BCDB